MEMNEILENVVYAGKILLESGAEIYRVEETIQRMAINCGVETADAFVVPTGIMVSIANHNRTESKILRIRSRSINLDKIDRVNKLSREIALSKMDNTILKQKLKAIDYEQKYPLSVELAASSLATFAFAILFRGNWLEIGFSFIVGFFIAITSHISKVYRINFFISTLSSAFVGVFVTLMLPFTFNKDIVIISCLMLLVPGLAITNAIRDSVAQDLSAALNRLLETFLIAIAIALGAILAIGFATFLGGVL